MQSLSSPLELKLIGEIKYLFKESIEILAQTKSKHHRAKSTLREADIYMYT